MRLKFVEKNDKLTDVQKEKINKKLAKLNKFLPEEVEATVTYRVARQIEKLEVSIPVFRRILRAEVSSNDVLSEIGILSEKLEVQILRHKGRLRNRSRNNKKFVDELNYYEEMDKEYSDNEIIIKKSKKFAIKPMEAEDAVMEMELLGHDFYVFRNAGSDELNVVYKRRDGTYGLIEPEI